jgi:hypothetical protein
MGSSLKSNRNRKNSSTYANKPFKGANTNTNAKLSENVAKAKNIHTSFSMTMYVALVIGIMYPLYLIIPTALVSYLFFNKKAKQRMYVSTAAYNLQAFKINKARELLEKARRVNDNELVQELENDINSFDS